MGFCVAAFFLDLDGLFVMAGTTPLARRYLPTRVLRTASISLRVSYVPPLPPYAHPTECPVCVRY